MAADSSILCLTYGATQTVVLCSVTHHDHFLPILFYSNKCHFRRKIWSSAIPYSSHTAVRKGAIYHLAIVVCVPKILCSSCHRLILAISLQSNRSLILFTHTKNSFPINSIHHIQSRFDLLRTKFNLNYVKSVPRSKHTPSQLQKPVS